MKKISGALAVLVLIATVEAALAQPRWAGSGGWGMGSAYQRMYNTATVETITGTVLSIDQAMPMKGMSYGVHITVQTDKETIQVHLGPGWYIERLDTKIEKGDRVEAKGSRITMAGKPAIIAAELKKGDAVLKLRDESGFPVWAGWKR